MIRRLGIGDKFSIVMTENKQKRPIACVIFGDHSLGATVYVPWISTNNKLPACNEETYVREQINLLGCGRSQNPHFYRTDLTSCSDVMYYVRTL